MTKYTVKFTSKFKKDARRAKKQGRDIEELEKVVLLLQNGGPLPARMRDHPLVGNYSGLRECHISPDWLLIYKIESDVLVLTLSRTGSHAEIF